MLTDTHAHLDFPEFANDFAEVLARADAADVTRIITIGTTVEGSRRAVELAEHYPNVFATVGIHPSNAHEVSDDFPDVLRELARRSRVVALGEIGLDYHRLPSKSEKTRIFEDMGFTSAELPGEVTAPIRDGAIKSAQAAVFQQQLDLAVEFGLNVVIHERDAWDDALELLRPYTGRLKAVFHCFGKSLAQAREVLALGHLVSFTGIVTFKNAPTVQETAAQIPGGSFMVETDCPYLAPVPFRGKRCEPAHTRIVAERIAELRGESLIEVAGRTNAAADNFFRFKR